MSVVDSNVRMGTLIPTRTCNSCRTVIDDPSYQYKACTKCLEKSRAYGKRYKEKKKLEKEQRDGLQLSAATSGKSTKVKSEPKAKIQLSAVSILSQSLMEGMY